MLYLLPEGVELENTREIAIMNYYYYVCVVAVAVIILSFLSVT